MPMLVGYVIALFLISAGIVLFVIGLGRVRYETAEQVKQGSARFRAYYEIPSYLRAA